MGTTEIDIIESPRKSVIEKQNIVNKPGDEVRPLKASKASKEAIENAVNQLKELKLELQSVSKEP